MKKSISIAALILFAVLTIVPTVSADFNQSFRNYLSFGALEDDWDFIVNPMFYSGLKGKYLTAGMDRQWAAGAYVGAGLDLFGMKQTLALNYTENKTENLDIIETDKKMGVSAQTYVSNKTTKNEDTIDTAGTRNLDIHVGWGLPMGDMNLGIGLQLLSSDGDSEMENHVTGTVTSNGVVQSYDNFVDTYTLNINSDTTMNILLGGNFGNIEAQIGFGLLTENGTGSKVENLTTTKNDTGVVLQKQETTRAGRYTALSASPVGNFDTSMAMTGTAIEVQARMKMSDLMRPGVMFRMVSLGADDDEKDVTQEVIASTFGGPSFALSQKTTTLDTLAFDVKANSTTVIGVKDDAILKLNEDLLLVTGLGWTLTSTKKEFTVTGTRVVTTLNDGNLDGDFTDVGIDTSTVQTRSGMGGDYLRESSSHAFSIPIMVEVMIAKGLCLRAGTQLTYTLTSTKTVQKDTGGAYKTVVNTDNLAGTSVTAPQDYTLTTTTDDDSSAVLSKRFLFGAGWDISEKISLDMVAFGDGWAESYIGIGALAVEGTIRF